MLGLRPYKPCDAHTIASWLMDERALRLWSSDRFANFPVTAQDINEKYLNNNGDCPDADNFYPLTAFDECGIIGHLILRFTDKEKATLRFGFVIVDASKRGKGYGKEILSLALKYSFEIFGAKKVTLGVFDCNHAAYHCYKSVGFEEIAEQSPQTYTFHNEQWTVIELEKEKV